MCWNATVSLYSFFIGLLAIVIGRVNGLNLTLLFFCASITLMQGIEAIVWTYLESPLINELASRAAALLLWVQPLASIQTLHGTLFSEYRVPLLISYTVLSLFNHLQERRYRMSPRKGHLEWEWLLEQDGQWKTLSVYFIFLLLPLFLVPNPILLLAVLSTLGISVYAYGNDNTWGSLWCWQVNIIAIAIIGWRVLSR